jgi:hypothetical protein
MPLTRSKGSIDERAEPVSFAHMSAIILKLLAGWLEAQDKLAIEKAVHCRPVHQIREEQGSIGKRLRNWTTLPRQGSRGLLNNAHIAPRERTPWKLRHWGRGEHGLAAGSTGRGLDGEFQPCAKVTIVRNQDSDRMSGIVTLYREKAFGVTNQIG